MIKNEDENNEAGETFILCENFEDVEGDENDDCSKFMFRAQNLTLLKYDRDFILGQ